jgi:xanthine/CO dehydrogenase XdhC/CoxF family maturation factor
LIPEPKNPQIIAYETDAEDGGEEDARPVMDPGPSLGCGGRIEILIQRITPADPGPLAALIAVVRQRQRAALATVIRTGSAHNPDVVAGMGLISIGDEAPHGHIADPKLTDVIFEQLLQSPPADHAFRIHRHSLSRGGWAEVSIESMVPSQALAIFGDGHDVAPLVELAHMLGWHVTAIFPRPIISFVPPTISRPPKLPPTPPP